MSTPPTTTALQDRYPHSELVLAIVSPVGSPLEGLGEILTDALRLYRYTTDIHRLSSLLKEIPSPALRTQIVESSEYDRIRTLMDAGDEVRESTRNGGTLALYAVSKIYESRASSLDNHERVPLQSRAHVLYTLKHPEEAHILRRIYGPGFFIISVSSTEQERFKHLTDRKGMLRDQALALMERDENEEKPYGQRVRDTFQLGDVFVRTGPRMHDDVRRFIDLLFGSPRIFPTRDEHAMFLAYASSMRSADLSRQVGAVILNAQGDVIATGCNDVPRPGGGQYQTGDDPDVRDYAVGHDSNAKEIAQIATDTVERLAGTSTTHSPEQMREKLRGGRLYDLTEFGRAVHAEMEALCCCARTGVSPRGGVVFTTTFPCHNCAKHLIAVGITRVVYVEPYPKSKAHDLYPEAIELDGEVTSAVSMPQKVQFRPFVGVGARRYVDLFSMNLSSGAPIKRKERSGDARLWTVPQAGSPRVPMWPATYIEREEIAVRELNCQRPPLPAESELTLVTTDGGANA